MDNVRGNGVEIPPAPFRPSTFSEWFCGANPQHVPPRTQERTHPRTRYNAAFADPANANPCKRHHLPAVLGKFRTLSLSKTTTSGVSVKLTLESVAFVSPRRDRAPAGSRCSNGKTIFSRWRELSKPF